MFIQLAWKLLIIPDMEPRLLEVLVRVLLCLLKKRSLITPADLGEEDTLTTSYLIKDCS